MVNTRKKSVFEGTARIRVKPDRRGGGRVHAEVDGPGADTLEAALQSLCSDLQAADRAELIRMAEEMA